MYHDGFDFLHHTHNFLYSSLLGMEVKGSIGGGRENQDKTLETFSLSPPKVPLN